MRAKLLILAFLLQFALIGASFANAYLAVFLGDEVRVRAQGIDPSHFLYGNFVKLSYDLPLKDSANLLQNAYKNGKKEVYFTLKEGADGIWKFEELRVEKPENEIFIIAKINSWYDVGLEIERYFATPQKAKEIERLLIANNAIITLKVYKGGARIVDLNIN